jgi:putative RNA 2'-phosphotransferase
MSTDSVRLSRLLRHQPERLGLTLAARGWAEVASVLRALGIDRATLERIVATSDRQRFELSADGRSIRARYGHSVAVELGLETAIPPELLYHGTVERFLPSILARGLSPGSRRHVHLSETTEIARAVGARRGRPVLLSVRARALQAQGQVFHRTPAGIWLTGPVPPEFVERLNG